MTDVVKEGDEVERYKASKLGFTSLYAYFEGKVETFN